MNSANKDTDKQPIVAATIIIMLRISSAKLWISAFTNLARVQIRKISSAVQTIPYKETVIKTNVRLYALLRAGSVNLKHNPIKISK